MAPDAASHRRPSARGCAGIAAALLAVVAATNRWVSWAEGFRLLNPLDERSYIAIARAAPHLPKRKLPQEHAQRFVFHYLIGLIAHGVGLAPEKLYLVAAVLVMLVLVGLMALVLRQLEIGTSAFAICLAVFVLNTYSLRYYLLAPGEIADLLFEVGLVVSLLGLLRARYPLVLLGVVVATLARQTEVPVALVTAAWVYAGPGWTAAPQRDRLLRAGLVLAITAAIYIAEVAISAPFGRASTPDFTHWFLISDVESLPTGAGALGQHFLRSVNGLLAVAALFAVAVWAGRRGRATTPGGAAGLASPLLWTLAVAAAIIIQPLAFSAQYAAHNETRLAILGLAPCVVALGYVLKPLLERRPLSSRTTWVLLVILAVDSLHHIYTTIGTDRASQTVILQIVCAAALAAVLAWPEIRARRSVVRSEK
jgi:hypothetical protein